MKFVIPSPPFNPATTKLNAFAATSSSELAAVISDETGSGALAFATGPTLVSPTLGTPAYGVGTNIVSLPISTGVSGLGAGVSTLLAGAASGTGGPAGTTAPTFTGALKFQTLLGTNPNVTVIDANSGVFVYTGGAWYMGGALRVASTAQIDLDAYLLANAIFYTAGKGIQLQSGAGARAGTATLIGGTVTVTNTTVGANSLILLTRKTSGGTIGTAVTYTISNGASFTINSDSVIDTSTFSFFIFELN